MTTAVICADCSSPMVLKPSKFGQFYGCTRFPECRGSHGAHPDGRPLGIPATAAVKELRMEVHKLLEDVFGPWSSKVAKKQTYAWLHKQGVQHIAELDKEDLYELRDKIKEQL